MCPLAMGHLDTVQLRQVDSIRFAPDAHDVWHVFLGCLATCLARVVPCRLLCFNAIQCVHHNGHCCQQGRRYHRITRDSEKRPPARQQGGEVSVSVRRGVVVMLRALCSQSLPRQSNNIITRSARAAQTPRDVEESSRQTVDATPKVSNGFCQQRWGR